MFCLKDNFTLPTIQNHITSSVAQRASIMELQWLEKMRKMKNGLYDDLISGIGSTSSQVFLMDSKGRKMYVDGFAPWTKTVFEFLGWINK